MIFKPGHVNPTEHATRPFPIGSSSSMRKEFQAALSAQTASPRQRLIWPETSQHVVGWFQQCPGDGLPREERKTLDGLSPRANVGWVENSSINAILPRAREGQPSASSSAQRPRRGSTGEARFSPVAPVMPVGSAPKLGAPSLPPVDNSQGVLVQAARAACKRKERPKRDVPLSRDRNCAPPPPSPKSRHRARIPDEPKPSAGGSHVDEAIGWRLAHVDPWSSATKEASEALRPTASQEQALTSAAERSKSFMNGPRNQWYRPAASSDVAEFANAYTKSWGVPLFYRKRTSNIK